MARTYYSGRFYPEHPGKYSGDVNKIIYRSSWERMVLKWCDLNPDVVLYHSEETVVPYICKTDGKKHQYFVDLTIKFKSGKVVIVEIKPKAQTIPPKTPKRKTKSYVESVLTYAKNQSKWEAASSYAKSNGWLFEVWTEDTLKSMGIKII